MTKPKPQKLPTHNDYVLATKWRDGDPQDHWCIGFYDRQDSARHFVKDDEGNQFRVNGFRRVKRISTERGSWMLANIENIQDGGYSLWWWVRAPMTDVSLIAAIRAAGRRKP